MEPIIWLILLAVLLVIEIITLGLTTIWFAAGALGAFFVSLASDNMVIQLLVFFVVSLVLLIFTRPIATRFFNTGRVKTNYESLVGKEGRVTERIDNFNQTGTVVLNGQEWTARAVKDQIIETDVRVRVVNITGVKLIVTDKKEEF